MALARLNSLTGTKLSSKSIPLPDREEIQINSKYPCEVSRGGSFFRFSCVFLGVFQATFCVFRQRFFRGLGRDFFPLLGKFCGPTGEQYFPSIAAKRGNVATLPPLRKVYRWYMKSHYPCEVSPRGGVCFVSLGRIEVSKWR